STLKQNATPVHQKVDERACGQALDHAAAAVQSNRQYIADARRIMQQAPDVAEAIRRGTVPTMTVARAAARSSTYVCGRRPGRRAGVSLCSVSGPISCSISGPIRLPFH